MSGAHRVEDIKHLIVESFPCPPKEPLPVFAERGWLKWGVFVCGV